MASGSSQLDTEAVRDHTRRLVQDASSAACPVLVEAPPAAGKTTAAFNLVHTAEAPITYLAERTDLYAEAQNWVDNEPGVTGATIPSPHRDCPTFRDENDGELAKAEQLYSKGVSGTRIHYHDKVYTPCDSEDNPCPYINNRDEVEEGLEKDRIDLLIGNHKHAHNSEYISNRIVVIDEFNPSPFLEQFPSTGGVQEEDHPGQIIPHFLEQLAQSGQDFPTDTFRDISDLIINRTDEEALKSALSWFEDHDVTRSAVTDYDFYNVTTYRHDPTHRLAPLLTLALLSMRRVGTGIELAPPPDDYDAPRIREAWTASALQSRVRCLRNRNTGEIFLLRPPDLTSAEQVIGLDGLPSKQLWDLLFSTDQPFEHQTVISRDDFTGYLSSALNMTIKQIGEGRYPYAGARISERDKYRFAVIRAIEGRPFALISTKKALEEYESRGWLENTVKNTPEGIMNGDFENQYAVMHYATVTSSNDFAKEDLGVVSGSPFPGYETMRIWAGLCGEEVEIPDENEDISFDGVVKEIYEHFSEHQVIQGVLRFGRDQSVWGGSGSTIYVNTQAVPDWFDPQTTLTVDRDSKAGDLITYLIKAARTDEKEPLAEQNVASIVDELAIDRTYVHELLTALADSGLLQTSDRGAGGSTLYQWDGDDALMELNLDDENLHTLAADNKLHVLEL